MRTHAQANMCRAVVVVHYMAFMSLSVRCVQHGTIYLPVFVFVFGFSFSWYVNFWTTIVTQRLAVGSVPLPLPLLLQAFR